MVAAAAEVAVVVEAVVVAVVVVAEVVVAEAVAAAAAEVVAGPSRRRSVPDPASTRPGCSRTGLSSRLTQRPGRLPSSSRRLV